MKDKVKEYQNLILAAWFHDIGKFYQRAGYKLDSPRDEESMTMFARKHGEGVQAKYSHLHAIFSDKFFQEYFPAFDIVSTLTALHHSPEKAGTERMRYLAKLITLADWMASGERRERDSEEGSEGYKAEPLICIFSRLQKERDEGETKEEVSYIPLAPLDDSLENLFPVKSKKEAFKERDGQACYQSLWKQFVADANLIDPLDFLNQIPFLLEKYTLTIPATTTDKPDLSLFHHAKSTAAIASCLYQLQPEEETLDLIFKEIKDWLHDSNQPISIRERETFIRERSSEWPNLLNQDFLLVGGDISGIQDFIYSVTSEKALKGLKGRSFYLQLVSEAVSRLILNEFALTEANLLYLGGGHFYVLVPKIGEVETRLKKIRQQIDGLLLQAHKGKLAILVDWVPLTYADFFISFASAWAQLSTRLGEIKKKKFASLFASPELENYWPKIMGPFDVGGEKKACEICSEELEGKDEDTCPLCQSFVSLADDLNRASAMALIKTSPQSLSNQISASSWKDVLLALGFDCRFWRESKEEGSHDEKKKYQVLNSTDFAGRFGGFRFVAKKIAGPNGKTLTLEEMAKQAEGIKKWGVLRADVDGLGKIFQEGLGEDRTISRMSMLSSMLSYYFNGRLNKLISSKENSQKEREKQEIRKLLDYIYIVYSGGDDLFLIGPWSVLPSLALKIYDDFYRFTSRKLTLSAGIYLAPTEKFPIYQAADEAGEAEDIAKKAGRNRVCFLEKPMPWKKLEEVREIAYRIKNLLEGETEKLESETNVQSEKPITQTNKKIKAVPRALLSVLYDAYQDKELKVKGEIPMERIWRLFYAFKKIMTKFKEQDKELKELEWLLKKAITDYEIYPELNVAVRWAEYLTREEKS
ncbi:MAG: type III-A CRISPR-associated protein Cas10/Csm1 [Candidatus Aminicenantes bacterium]|nr:type III-A CRISPR-associated protein Cas10/Csm1 [Candidatus Aminicenantes bacterium]